MTTSDASPPPSACPVCGTSVGAPFVSVASLPVHCNVLWATAEDAMAAPRGNLDLAFCETCGHVYNAAFDAARTTYGATYENSLHHSDVFQAYASALIDDLVARYGLRGKDIVEIGAGQGDFLEMLCERGGNRGAGFDPSYVGATHTSADVRLVPDFYDERFGDHPADVIVCRHVLEHIDRSGEFVAMIRRVIGSRDHVLSVFEVPDALWTFRDGGIWDLIYEHCGYFSPTSLRYVFAANAFQVERVGSVFGGQFAVLEATPSTDPTPLPETHAAEVASLRAQIERFAVRYAERLEWWHEVLRRLASEGRRAVIWGAGSKGVTFLNVVDTERVVDRAVDINPRKRGMHIAGTGHAIVGPDDLVARPPDSVVIMNPNYRAEVEARLGALGISAEVLVA